MQTLITISCDIQDMERIAYACKKIIEESEAVRKTDEEARGMTIHNWHDKAGYKPEARVMPIYNNPVAPEVMCPHCDWSGLISELGKDAEEKVICPKCQHWFSNEKYSISVYKFMSLDDSEKEKYTNVVDVDNEYDIKLFDRAKSGMSCEICGVGVNVERNLLIGTSDTREPKFCYVHYITINMNSRFVKMKGVE